MERRGRSLERRPAGWHCSGKLWDSTCPVYCSDEMLTASLVQSRSPGMGKEAEGLHLSGVEMSPRALWGPGWAVVHK